MWFVGLPVGLLACCIAIYRYFAARAALSLRDIQLATAAIASPTGFFCFLFLHICVVLLQSLYGTEPDCAPLEIWHGRPTGGKKEGECKIEEHSDQHLEEICLKHQHL